MAVAVTLAYPAGDLLLLCCAGVAFGITGWRPGRAWALLALSLVLTAIGDAIYSQAASRQSRAGSARTAARRTRRASDR
jgi:hypothetical protein